MGRGQSSHFSPAIKGKSNIESNRIHEQMAVDLIGVKAGQKILDAGCGIGGPMRAIVSHSGCNVTGITINEYQFGHELVLQTRGVKIGRSERTGCGFMRVREVAGGFSRGVMVL
ncbi:putative 24-methylenesterol C-methyltransferase [Helianthus anomalus]